MQHAQSVPVVLGPGKKATSGVWYLPEGRMDILASVFHDNSPQTSAETTAGASVRIAFGPRSIDVRMHVEMRV